MLLYSYQSIQNSYPIESMNNRTILSSARMIRMRMRKRICLALVCALLMNTTVSVHAENTEQAHTFNASQEMPPPPPPIARQIVQQAITGQTFDANPPKYGNLPCTGKGYCEWCHQTTFPYPNNGQFLQNGRYSNIRTSAGTGFNPVAAKYILPSQNDPSDSTASVSAKQKSKYVQQQNVQSKLNVRPRQRTALHAQLNKLHGGRVDKKPKPSQSIIHQQRHWPLNLLLQPA